MQWDYLFYWRRSIGTKFDVAVFSICRRDSIGDLRWRKHISRLLWLWRRRYYCTFVQMERAPFFILSFVLGLRILIRLDGGSGHFNDDNAVKPRWNAYVFVSVMRQKRFVFAVGAINFLTILCRCLFLV
jgi:hypothetical protein